MLQRNSSSATASKNQHDSRTPPEGLKSKALLMQSAALDRRLSSNAVHVLAVMLFDLCVTSIGVCRAKQDTIAKRMGVSVETVKRAIRELKAAGYLTVEQRYRTSAIYLFVWLRPVKSDRYGAEDRSNLTGQAGQNRPGSPVKSDRALNLDSRTRDSEPGEDSLAPAALAPDDAPLHMNGFAEVKQASGRPRKEASQENNLRRVGSFKDEEASQPSLAPEWEPKSSPSVEASFERFWSAYPMRDGINPRKPAADKFRAFVTRGKISPEAIIAGAKRYAASVAQVGTERRYIQAARNWLSGQGWLAEYRKRESFPHETPELRELREELFGDDEQQQEMAQGDGLAVLDLTPDEWRR